jgi:hypothetical protein
MDEPRNNHAADIDVQQHSRMANNNQKQTKQACQAIVHIHRYSSGLVVDSPCDFQ